MPSDQTKAEEHRPQQPTGALTPASTEELDEEQTEELVAQAAFSRSRLALLGARSGKGPSRVASYSGARFGS